MMMMMTTMMILILVVDEVDVEMQEADLDDVTTRNEVKVTMMLLMTMILVMTMITNSWS